MRELRPRIYHTSEIFSPPISYRVQTADWFDWEGTGNFLLVQPGNDLPE
jgi:hypothetical protein